MAHSIQMGLDPGHQMTEREIHDYNIPEDVGVHWKDLARALKFFQPVINTIKIENDNNPKECCTDLLVRWMSRKGRDATAGILADALRSIGLRSVADTLIYPNSYPGQIKEFEEIREKIVSLEAKVSKMSARNIKLEEEVSKMSARNIELEDEVSKMSARNIELEEEVTRMCTRNIELEEEVSKRSARNLELEEENQELRARLAVKDVLAVRYEHPVGQTDQATREFIIRSELKDINKRLHTHVTSPLEVSEVKQDQLDIAVKIDLLTKVTRSLQELYSAMQAMVGEACKCIEDTKTEYFDLAYYGLRAAHNDLIQRVNNLEPTQEMMSEEEKGKFQRLQTYQGNRQIQMKILENLWQSLFKSPEHLPKTPGSEPLAVSDKPSHIKKVSRHTDPGSMPKKPTSVEEGASTERPPSTNEEGVDDVPLTLRSFTQKKAIRSIRRFWKRNNKDEEQCSIVSYTPRRDS